MTDSEVPKSGRAALVTKLPMSTVNRAIEKGETQGFIKISVDAETKHITGAAILGTGGDEVVHVLLDVMYAKAPYTVVQPQCIFIRRLRNISPPSFPYWNPLRKQRRRTARTAPWLERVHLRGRRDARVHLCPTKRTPLAVGDFGCDDCWNIIFVAVAGQTRKQPIVIELMLLHFPPGAAGIISSGGSQSRGRVDDGVLCGCRLLELLSQDVDIDAVLPAIRDAASAPELQIRLKERRILQRHRAVTGIRLLFSLICKYLFSLFSLPKRRQYCRSNK
jgi:hypothetical protein